MGLPPRNGKRLAARFQKRNLLAHKMGVIDEDYCTKDQRPRRIVGRKVQLAADEVFAAIAIVETLGGSFYARVLRSGCMSTGAPAYRSGITKPPLEILYVRSKSFMADGSFFEILKHSWHAGRHMGG